MNPLSNQRGSIGSLIVLLALLLCLFIGLHAWSPRKPPVTPAPGPSPQIGKPSPPSFSYEPAPAQKPPNVLTPQLIQIPLLASASLLSEIHRLIEQGQYAEAEATLRTLPADTLDDPAVRLNVAALWNNLGVGQARTTGAVAGLPAYKTAVALDARNAQAYLNLVLAYWELKDPALSTEMLEHAMQLLPREPMPHIMLAERAIARDDLAGAALHLEQAQGRLSGSPQAESYLKEYIGYLEKARRSEHKFMARDSAHFIVKYDGGEDHDVWRRVLDILEEAHREVGQQLGYFATKPILVVLHTRERFHDATGGPAWADGLYDPRVGRIRIPTQGALTDLAWLTRVLRHEFVHALLDQRMGGRTLPTWFNEGLAMQLAGDPPPDIPAFVRGEITMTNLTYLEGPWGGLSPQHAMVAYLEGNSATRYLIDRYGMDRVRGVLEKMATGLPFASALQDRVSISYEDFQRRWVESLNQRLSRVDP